MSRIYPPSHPRLYPALSLQGEEIRTPSCPHSQPACPPDRERRVHLHRPCGLTAPCSPPCSSLLTHCPLPIPSLTPDIPSMPSPHPLTAPPYPLISICLSPHLHLPIPLSPHPHPIPSPPGSRGRRCRFPGRSSRTSFLSRGLGLHLRNSAAELRGALWGSRGRRPSPHAPVHLQGEHSAGPSDGAAPRWPRHRRRRLLRLTGLAGAASPGGPVRGAAPRLALAAPASPPGPPPAPAALTAAPAQGRVPAPAVPLSAAGRGYLRGAASGDRARPSTGASARTLHFLRFVFSILLPRDRPELAQLGGSIPRIPARDACPEAPLLLGMSGSVRNFSRRAGLARNGSARLNTSVWRARGARMWSRGQSRLERRAGMCWS